MADMRTGLIEQMGGESKVSFAQRRIIGHIATMELLVSLAEAKVPSVARSKTLGIAKDIAFLIGSAIRIYTLLGLDRQQRPELPSFHEYLDSKRLKVVGPA